MERNKRRRKERKKELVEATQMSRFFTYDSISEARNVLDTLVGWASFKRNTLSMTEISVDVELMPTKALQSFTTQPAANTSLPRFTVPACDK